MRIISGQTKRQVFQKHLKTDINCLIETFTTEDSKLNLKGYVVDHSFRSNSNKNARRNSERIVVYIKSEISKATESLHSEHEDLIWIKLKKDFLNMTNDLYIGVVYIVPSNSSSLNTKSDAYDILEKEMSYYASLGDIILGGDFNSRLGYRFKDYIRTDSNEFLPIDQSFQIDYDNVRNSQNKKDNSYGKHLSESCMTHNLKILNGRTAADMIGKYTCFKYNGCSVVDYIMVDRDVHENAMYFKVMPLTSLSDHCQIKTELTIKPRAFTFTSKGNKGKKAQPQHKWDNISVYKVNSYVTSGEFLEQVDVIHNMLSSTGDVNNDVENINSLLINVSDRCLKVVEIKKHKKRNKEYFDTNCYNKRREAQRLGKLVNNSPYNISLRKSYHQTKRMYKLMIKINRGNTRNKNLNKFPI